MTCAHMDNFLSSGHGRLLLPSQQHILTPYQSRQLIDSHFTLSPLTMADQIEVQRSMYTDDLDLRGGFSLFPGFGEMLIATYAEDGREETMVPVTLGSSGRSSSSSDRTTARAMRTSHSDEACQHIPQLTTRATSRKPMSGLTVAANCHSRVRKPKPRRKRALSTAQFGFEGPLCLVQG